MKVKRPDDAAHWQRKMTCRLRAEFIAGAEEEWRKRTGRRMTAEEVERVLRDVQGLRSSGWRRSIRADGGAVSQVSGLSVMKRYDPTPKARPVSTTQQRSVRPPWPTLLALILLGLFWFSYGLLGVLNAFRFAGVGDYPTAFLLADLEWTALFTGFGIAHLVAAYGIQKWRGWAILLAAVLALLGLLALGSAAHSVIMMTADAEGHFDIPTVSIWRFNGWQAIGIFGLLVLADVVVLVSVARVGLRRLRAHVASDKWSA